MDKLITMSQKEARHYDIIQKAINKQLSSQGAADLLGITARHVRRLKSAVRKNGLQGMAHGLRGRSGNRSLPPKEKQRMITLLHKHYSDFGPLLASEKLEEYHGIRRDKGTIRSIMIQEGLWKPKTKKKDKHRSWRQRKASPGEMVQYDGSYEYWFEGRADKCCLLAAIDDATGRVWARFDEHEGVEPTFTFWKDYIMRFGKPFSVYADKFSTYSMNHKLAQENPDTLTQFQRAMETDLNCEVIHAHSAEAKGRVENLFKTLQDRLIKELRLHNISTIRKANKFLEEDFLPRFNAKFMVLSRSQADLHKALSRQEQDKLDAIFSRQHERTVRNDFTLSYQHNWYQLTKEQTVTVRKQDKVTVEQRLDGSIHFRLRGKYLNYELLPARPAKQNGKDTPWVLPGSKAHKPPLDHPWKKAGQVAYLKKLSKMSK